MKRKKRAKLFPAAIAALIITSIIRAISRSSYECADALDAAVGAPIRRLMAFVSDPLHFSVFEILVLLLPLIAVLVIWRCVHLFKKGEGGVRFIANVLSVILLLYSANTLALGIAYNKTPVENRLSLPSVEVTEGELYSAMEELCLEINTLADKISYSDGESHMPYSFREMSDAILLGYDAMSEQLAYPDSFTSHVKGVDALHILSYLSLTGIYTYYTGEANVNTDYPDYGIAFTAAHEMAHQRGVMPENEANFVAYLALIYSAEDYLVYSAKLSMLSYVGTALWRTNPDAYYELLERLDERALDDMRAYSAVTREYSDTILSDISSAVNDLFLKSNGTDGVVTYGRVVTLYMSYRELS